MKKIELYLIKLLSISLCVALFICTTFVVPKNIVAETLTSVSSPRAVTVENNVFLGNAKMELGINQYGTFGSTVTAPIGFHPWSGASNFIGMVSSSLDGSWGVSRDYFLPGTVDEGFAFAWSEAEGENAECVSQVQSNNLGGAGASANYTDFKTTNHTNGTSLLAITNGKVANTIDYQQNVSIEGDSGLAEITLTMKNTSSNTIHNFEYLRGFDPDQSEEYYTNNYFAKDENNTVWVIASTNSSPIGELAFDDFVANTTFPFMFIAPQGVDYKVEGTSQGVGWKYADVNNVDAAGSSNIYRYGNSKYEDRGMGLRFTIDTIKPNETKEIVYYMSLDADIQSAIKDFKVGMLGKQPESIVAKVGDTVEFSVDLRSLFEENDQITSDTNYTYQWYTSDNVNSEGTPIPDANTIKFSSTSSQLGTQYYYCIVTPENQESVKTNYVRVTIVSSQSEESKKVTVKFDANTSDEVKKIPFQQVMLIDNKILKPIAPTRNGYRHTGWYTTADCNTKWDFDSDVVTNDLTLYSGWEIVADLNLSTNNSIVEMKETVKYTASFTDNYKPSGIVTFKMNDKILGNATLVNGVATLNYTFNERMEDVIITATYDQSQPVRTASDTVIQSVTFIQADFNIEDIADKSYTSKEIKPMLVVSHAGQELQLGKDYTVSYDNNINVGIATVSVTGIGDYVGNATENFNITPINPSYTVPTDLIATYGDSLNDVELPNGFSFENDLSTLVGNSGNNTFTVKYTPSDSHNYNTITNIEVIIDVRAKKLIITPNSLHKFYGENDDVLTYLYSGNVTSEIPKFTGTLERISGEEIGNYLINKGTLTLIDNDKFLSNNYIISFEEGVEYQIKTYTPKENATALLASNKAGWYNQDSLTLQAPLNYKISLTNGVSDTFEDTITVKLEETAGDFINYYLKNSDGAISTVKKFNYKVDKTAPIGIVSIDKSSWGKLLEIVTFGIYKSDDFTTKITSEDLLSGVKKVEYFVAKKAMTVGELHAITDWNTYEDLFTIQAEDEKQVLIYVKITDYADNYCYLNTDGILFDTTPPIIEGVEDHEFYHKDLNITVSDLNLDTVTLNGKQVENKFTVKADKDATYTIVATDKSSQSTKLTFKTYTDFEHLIDDTFEIEGSDKLEQGWINGFVNEVVQGTNKETAKNDKEYMDYLYKLDREFNRLNGNLNVIPKEPTIDDNISQEKRAVITNITPKGMAIAVLGVNENVLLNEIELSLSVKQQEGKDDNLVFDVKPLISINANEPKVIPNNKIKSPITFRLYLNKTFKGTIANIEHIRVGKEPEYYNKVPVIIDKYGPYVELTTDEFSQFKVKEISYDVIIDDIKTEYKVNEIVNLTIPRKDGFEFVEWISKDVTIKDNTFIMPEQDVVIVSKWIKTPNIPETGDGSNKTLWIALLMFQFAGLALMVQLKTKEKEKR